MNGKIASWILCWVISVLGASGLARADGDLNEQLGNLDRLRRGSNTPFADVERLGQQVLKDFPAPEDQGRIYYHLCHTHGQADIRVKERGDRVIEYAQKGLACPLDAARRLQLYSYWADAIRARDRGRRLSPEARKEAATVLLKGLKESLPHNIPDEFPESGVPPLLIGPPPAVPAPEYEAARQKAAQIAVSQKRVRQERELWLRRKVLLMQIIDVYRQKPHAASELRELATCIVADQATVDRLMSRLKEIGAFEDE